MVAKPPGEFKQTAPGGFMQRERISNGQAPGIHPFGNDRVEEFKNIALHLRLLARVEIPHGLVVANESAAGIRGDNGRRPDALRFVSFDKLARKSTFSRPCWPTQDHQRPQWHSDH